MHSGATAYTGLSACFLINSPSLTFSIFLTFILCTPCILVFSLMSTLVYLIHHLVYLVLSIFFNSMLFAYISHPFSALSRPCRTPNLPHSPLSLCSLIL